jgi:peroxiredoxin
VLAAAGRYNTPNMPMRPSSVAVVAICALAGFTAWITHQAKTLEQDLDGSPQKIALLDQPAPDFRLTSLDGRAISLADYRGRKKVVLIFWATWNNASHPQMAMVSTLYQNNHKPESDFEIVGVSVDDEKPAVQKFVAQSKIAFPVVLDQRRSLADAYKIRSIPTMLLVDAGGKVSYGSVGFNQRGQNEFASRLGVRAADFRMEMRGPNGGRGN